MTEPSGSNAPSTRRRLRGAVRTAGGSGRFFAVALVAALIGNSLLLPLAGIATLVVVVGLGVVLGLRQVEFGLVLIVVSGFVIPTRFGLVGFSLVMASGLLGLGLWFAGRLVSGPPRARIFGAVDVLAVLFFVAHLVSYANAALSARTDRAVAAGDRQLVLILAYLGMLLFVMEVVTIERQVYWVLNLLLLGAGFMAAVAIAEFVTGASLADSLRPPGFTTPPEGLGGALEAPERFGLTRVFGTAQGTIEFSAVLVSCFPLAIFHWLRAPTVAMRRVGAAVTGLILIGVPLAASRTGIVGLVMGILLTYVGLDRELRERVFKRAIVFIVGAIIVIPTSLSVASQVVVNFASDEQNLGTEGRTGDYSIVRSIVLDKPVLGSGLANFDPTEARIVDDRRIRNLFLDNQYLSTAVDSGFVGLAALVAMPLGGILVARAARRRTENERLRVLMHCASVSLAVSGMTWAFYDSFAFRTAMLTFFMILAIVGAVDGVTRNEGRRRRDLNASRASSEVAPA